MILNYTFDGDKFECYGYNPAQGVTIVDVEVGDGTAKVTLMAPSYKAENLGEIMLRAKADAPLVRGRETVKVDAEYVLRDENGGKSINTAKASTSFTTLGGDMIPGDTNDDGVVDIIDLSNMVDWFGINDSHADWDTLYTYFDFDDSGDINIYDISYVAKLIQ